MEHSCKNLVNILSCIIVNSFKVHAWQDPGQYLDKIYAQTLTWLWQDLKILIRFIDKIFAKSWQQYTNDFVKILSSFMHRSW